MNFLLTSVGRRVRLTQYFKQELNAIGSKVVAADCDTMASALYFADHFEIVPSIVSPDYIPELLRICEQHDIRGVLSLIDPELSILAPHRELFASRGITLILSDPDVIELCYDKHRTYETLSRLGIPAVPTYRGYEEAMAALDRGDISFPLFAKPRKGSSSHGIQILRSEDDFLFRARSGADDIFQTYMQGEEFCTDIYCDMVTGLPISVFCKQKVLMRAGEADKSISVHEQELTELTLRILQAVPLRGPVDMDFFKTEQGYVLSEINPRFGGGYPHAYEAGQNYIKHLIRNLSGQPNESEIGDYEDGIIMMKYDQVLIGHKTKNPKGMVVHV